MPSRGPRSFSAESLPPFVARIAEDEIVLEWRAVGRFTIRRGGGVEVRSARGVPVGVVRNLARGPVAAVRLRQLGYLVLHGSAVTIGRKAVVLCGASGWGKSTLAAALHRRGHRLLADDFAAIRIAPRGPTLLAGPPLLKLWPDSLRALGLNPAALPRLHPLVNKRRVRTRRLAGARAIRLGRVVILAPGAPLEITALGHPEALVELLRHSYGARTFATLHAADHFARCAALVRAVPIARLGTGASLSALDGIAARLETAPV